MPTSATDWFAYIANHGVPEVLDGPRDWQSQDHYDFVTDRIKHIGELMSTDAQGGTTGLGPINGLVNHLQATAPSAFIVTGDFAAPLHTIAPEHLFNAMSNGGMISMTLGKYEKNSFGHWERTGGHIVALHRVKNGYSSSPQIVILSRRRVKAGRIAQGIALSADPRGIHHGYSLSTSSARGSKTRCQTPLSDHRL